MIAAAIIPGQLYRVRGFGQCFVVIADHACVAIAITVERMKSCAD